jgi:poly(3-hydroxyoctanoate) depolymerase
MTQASGPTKPAPDALAAPPEARVSFVEVDGVRIRVSVRGEGRPLLLVMGIGGNLEMWGPFERHLDGHGIQTIAFDAPGSGESTTWRRPRRMGGIANTVDHLLDKMGYGRVDVLGVSFGGALSQQITRDHPERVRRLVLCATGPGVPGLGGVPGRPRAMLALATPRRYYSPEYFREVSPVLYGGKRSIEPDLLTQQAHARFAKPPSPRGYFNQLWAMQAFTMVPWLPRMRQATLVMSGDDDPIVPLGNSRILVRLLPNSRLYVVKGGGHLFLLQAPGESAEQVAAFLAEPSLPGDPPPE